MAINPWSRLDEGSPDRGQPDWLSAMLKRNMGVDYLDRHGNPLTLQSFRDNIPLCDYDDLLPYIERLKGGESDVIFRGKPVAYERTGGSTGGVKLIPYSRDGLLDFQRCTVPWLARTTRTHGITGLTYFSTSPSTRKPEFIDSIPIGLPDAAYLGEQAAHILAQQAAVPFAVGNLTDVADWRQQTIAHLKAASNLELISVWSPTFLLRLLEEIPDPQRCWPQLKLISCWASGSARRYAEQLQILFPHVTIQPKGLLSTEAVVTVPDHSGKPVLSSYNFVEFAQGSNILLDDELSLHATYEVVITTASGLYRYKTGDRVRFEGRNENGLAVLEFMGRDSLSSDMVGEKLTEAFVSKCIQALPGFALLVPDVASTGYVLISDQMRDTMQLTELEMQLSINPQYAYARKIGQLAPLRALTRTNALAFLEQTLMERGTRMGDIKPLALRSESFWLPLFEKGLP
jgi:hypothetical protein